MSAECARAAATRRSSDVTAAQPAWARSWFTIARTSASNAALPVGPVVGVGEGDGDGDDEVGGGEVGSVGGVVGSEGDAVPGSPGVVAVGTGVGAVPSVVITSLSRSGAT